MIAQKIKSVKSVYSLIVSFLAALLHSLCCLLPLVSVTTVSTSLLAVLTPYKPVLLFVQLLIILFISYRIFLSRKQKVRRHHYLDYLMIIIAITGLVISWLEPFKTERQLLAERQFEIFKNNRSLTIQLADSLAAELAGKELRQIKGIRTVRIIDQEIQINYNYGQVKQEEIIEELKSKKFLFEY